MNADVETERPHGVPENQFPALAALPIDQRIVVRPRTVDDLDFGRDDLPYREFKRDLRAEPARGRVAGDSVRARPAPLF
jgi:hypothetical protein